MKTLKSTLESFKENELTKKNKVKIYGGLPQDGLSLQELPLEEEVDENGDPQNGAGPIGGGGPSSGSSVATLGNSTTSSPIVVVVGK